MLRVAHPTLTLAPLEPRPRVPVLRAIPGTPSQCEARLEAQSPDGGLGCESLNRWGSTECIVFVCEGGVYHSSMISVTHIYTILPSAST